MKKKESVNSFYNSIAQNYENQLTDFDKRARAEIAQLFKLHVHKGIILDFGGGTGLDLPWLLTLQNRVIFLEPSYAMRAMAKVKFEKEKRIMFLEVGLNFLEWSSEKLPFQEKVDGVLANFAVLNCVKDIDCFFERIMLVCKKDCPLMITVINPGVVPMTRNYSVFSALRLLYNNKLTILNSNMGIYHETYLHTIGAIKRESHKYFDFKSVQPVEFSNFVTICLVKR